jgi:ribosomal protein S18 acetylase RimI-like enzyme
MTDVLIRQMYPNDLPAGLELCRASGWNQLEDDWSLFLQSSPAGCRVAEKTGQVIGTVTTLRYEERFSWLSMLLVHPQQRRAGVGTVLLSEGLAVLSGEACVRLDATPAGRELYRQHGFCDEYPITRLTLNAPAASTPADRNAGRMSEEDLRAVLAEDRRIFGADREIVLRSLYQRSPECAYVVQQAGIQGYCFGRPGFLYHQLGPIIAQHESVARTLISECVTQFASQPGDRRLGIDVPQHSPSWLHWLKAQGFVEERSFIRMYRGPHRYPGLPERIYATVGPEFG